MKNKCNNVLCIIVSLLILYTIHYFIILLFYYIYYIYTQIYFPVYYFLVNDKRYGKMIKDKVVHTNGA